MEFPPPLERQSLVGGIADECMPKAKCAWHVGIALDEFSESVPCFGRGSDERVAFENLGDRRPGERHAKYRGPSQERTVSRSELIDSRRYQGLDGVGQIVHASVSPTLASSRRKSGFPAARSMSAATSSSLRRRSPAAASASAFASSSGSGSRRSVSAGRGGVPVAAANPSSPGRRVVHASHGLLGSWVPR